MSKLLISLLLVLCAITAALGQDSYWDQQNYYESRNIRVQECQALKMQYEELAQQALADYYATRSGAAYQAYLRYLLAANNLNCF